MSSDDSPCGGDYDEYTLAERIVSGLGGTPDAIVAVAKKLLELRPAEDGELAELERAAGEATPGPWTFDEPSPPAGAVDIRGGGECACDDPSAMCSVHEHIAEWVPLRDARFIGAARMLVPRLLARLRTAEHELRHARDEAARMRPVYEAACVQVDADGPLNENDRKRDVLCCAVDKARGYETQREAIVARLQELP